MHLPVHGIATGICDYVTISAIKFSFTMKNNFQRSKEAVEKDRARGKELSRLAKLKQKSDGLKRVKEAEAEAESNDTLDKLQVKQVKHNQTDHDEKVEEADEDIKKGADQCDSDDDHQEQTDVTVDQKRKTRGKKGKVFATEVNGSLFEQFSLVMLILIYMKESMMKLINTINAVEESKVSSKLQKRVSTLSYNFYKL